MEARATEQEWFELQQPQGAYARIFDSPKIVFPDIAPECRFAIDFSGHYIANTVYALHTDDRFLLGVLNSATVARFYRDISAQVRGGYMRFFRQYVEQIPIPTASASDRTAISSLAQKCLDAQGIGCEAWEKESDERVAALYGL